MSDRRLYRKCKHDLFQRHKVWNGDKGLWAQDTYWCKGAVLVEGNEDES